MDSKNTFWRPNFLPGFSLIEVLVVVAIVSLISITVGFSLSTLTPRKLEVEVRRLVGDLAWARSMAISTHRHYKVDFDIDSDANIDTDDNMTYIIYSIDPDDPTVPPAETAVKRGILAVDGITLVPGAGGPVVLLDLEFMNPQGSLNATISNPATIQLQKGRAEANITINNLTGRIDWERL